MEQSSNTAHTCAVVTRCGGHLGVVWSEEFNVAQQSRKDREISCSRDLCGAVLSMISPQSPPLTSTPTPPTGGPVPPESHFDLVPHQGGGSCLRWVNRALGESISPLCQQAVGHWCTRGDRYIRMAEIDK